MDSVEKIAQNLRPLTALDQITITQLLKGTFSQPMESTALGGLRKTKVHFSDQSTKWSSTIFLNSKVLINLLNRSHMQTNIQQSSHEKPFKLPNCPITTIGHRAHRTLSSHWIYGFTNETEVIEIVFSTKPHAYYGLSVPLTVESSVEHWSAPQKTTELGPNRNTSSRAPHKSFKLNENLKLLTLFGRWQMQRLAN